MGRRKTDHERQVRSSEVGGTCPKGKTDTNSSGSIKEKCGETSTVDTVTSCDKRDGETACIVPNFLGVPSQDVETLFE